MKFILMFTALTIFALPALATTTVKCANGKSHTIYGRGGDNPSPSNYDQQVSEACYKDGGNAVISLPNGGSPLLKLKAVQKLNVSK